jgi:spore coat protein CotH
MIKFDEFVDGQTYQGYTAAAVRTYGAFYDAAMLQEPVTNDIARLVGLPAAQTAYAGFRINDADETLYVISELINQEYLTAYFENANGVLYKAELGSTLSYQGDDPSSYFESFTQQTRVNDADLAPLIAFMRFLDQSDDAVFEHELPDYLDVDAFATYLAVNDLLVNTDSIIGMNNNYYLYYDDVAARFTLLMWDANESLGKLGGSATYALDFTNSQGNRGGFGRGGGPGGGRNALLTRFMANATFKALYEEKLQQVYQQTFLSGAPTEAVERFSALIRAVNDDRELVDITSYEQAVEETLTFIRQRTDYLTTTDLLGQQGPRTSL